MLTAVSYNIHQCVGTDGKRDPHRIATVIQDTKADIIGLQEVDLHPREKKSHQLDYFAHITGMKAVAGPTVRRADIEFGNALLTCQEILHVRFHDLTVVRRQPRGVIDAEIVCDGKIIRVLVTHFGLALKNGDGKSGTAQDTAPTKSQLCSYACHRRHQRVAAEGLRPIQSKRSFR